MRSASEPPFEVRHYGEHDVGGSTVVENPADVRVNELGGGLRLAPEPLRHFRVAGEMRVQHLDDDAARQLRLLGNVDIGHSTAAEPM